MATYSFADGGLVEDDYRQTVGLPEPFEEFYYREFPKMVDIAYARSGSRMAAEDLAQDTMIIAHRSWDQIGRLDRPGAWVRRVLLNRSASAFHRRKAEIKALARLAPLRGQPPAPLNAEAEEFWRQVRRLPARQGQAIALHYLEDLPIADIAEAMGCAENTVKVHLHRGRRSLAAALHMDQETS